MRDHLVRWLKALGLAAIMLVLAFGAAFAFYIALNIWFHTAPFSP
jgi:hypothetical protein